MRLRRSSRPGAAAGIAGPAARLGAAAGIAGPAAFTGAWIVASLRQAGHSAVAVQLSGLAAADARDPGIMITGFVALGACSVVFGESLYRALGGPGPPGLRSRRAGLRSRRAGLRSRRAGPGPRLIQGAGALTIAAGLLRRDHMVLGPPGGAVGESWHNHAHDVVSSVIYVLLVAAPVLLAVRFRGDASWRRLTAPLLAGSAATAGLLGIFLSPAFRSWDPVVQRAAVTVPLAMLTAVAARLITGPRAGESGTGRPLHLMHGGGWVSLCPPEAPFPSTDTRPRPASAACGPGELRPAAAGSRRQQARRPSRNRGRPPGR